MRNSFQTTNGTGLNLESYPMKLWQKAKKFGTWDPNAIDFSQDKEDWKNFSDNERTFILNFLAQFQAGEEAVTLDLLPLIMALAKDGRLEEEIFLTSFLWEEAKHVEGFHRFITEVTGKGGISLEDYLVPAYRQIFHEDLPNALNALTNNSNPVTMVKASVTYNMIVEGVLAETGYYQVFNTFQENGLMPGMTEFFRKLQQDESRHVAFGIYLISRLIAENGDDVWLAVQEQMNKMMVPALALFDETYALYEELPFGIDVEFYKNYAMSQFQKRWAKLEKARTQSVEELNKESIEEDEAVLV